MPANTLAYYDVANIAVMKDLILQDPGVNIIEFFGIIYVAIGVFHLDFDCGYASSDVN